MERFSRLFEPFGLLLVNIVADTSRSQRDARHPGDAENALRLFATEIALEILDRYEKARNRTAVEFSFHWVPPEIETFTCYCWGLGPSGRSMRIRCPEAPDALCDWLAGVRNFQLVGRVPPWSAHQRLALEHRRHALRARCFEEGAGISE